MDGKRKYVSIAILIGSQQTEWSTSRASLFFAISADFHSDFILFFFLAISHPLSCYLSDHFLSVGICWNRLSSKCELSMCDVDESEIVGLKSFRVCDYVTYALMKLPTK